MSVGVVDRDLRALFDVVRAAEDDRAGDALSSSALADLASLTRSDVVSFFELDSQHQTTGFMQTVPSEDDSDDEEVFWANYWDCLACCYPDRSGDTRSVTLMSDFYGQRERLRLGMYTDYLRPARLEHELLACFPVGVGSTVRLALFRGAGPDFTDRERTIVSLLRPHLREIYLDHTRRRDTIELTARQQQLLRLVASGHTNGQIARRLAISEGTVRKHLENIFGRLGVTNRTAAVTQAFPEAIA